MAGNTMRIGLDNGMNVEVDDSFANLPPDQQNAQIEEIAKGLPNNTPALLAAPELPGQRLGEIAGSGAIKGALQGVGMVPDVLNAGVNALRTSAPLWLGGNNAIPSLPGSQELINAGRNLGLVDVPSLKPQNALERYVAAGSQGAGAALPYSLSGPGAIARGLIQGFAQGTGGEAGADLLQNTPAAGRLAGALAGGKLGGTAFNAIGRGANSALGNSNPLIQAYDEAGVTPRLVGDVTQRPMLQGIQAMAMKAPGGGRAVEAAKEGISEFGQGLENAASGLGRSETLEDAGRALQDEARNWITNWRSAQQNAENAVSAKVPATASVDLTPVNAVLRSAATQMPGLPSVADVMTDPTFKQLYAGLAKDAVSGIASWSDMRAWRTKIGEELQQSLLSRDGKQDAWRQLYGGVSDALGSTAAAHGAGAEWANANAVTNQGHQFVENVLGDIINNKNPGQNTIAPEKAAQAALSSARYGGSALRDIRAQMPAGADELAAFKLRSMGSATPGAQNATGSAVSPNTYLTQLNSLAPEARHALFAGTPSQDKIDALAKVAESMRGTTSKFGNPSGTGGNLEHAAAVAAPLAAVEGAIRGYEGGGLKGAILGGVGAGLLPYAPGFLGSNLTAREGLARYLAAPTIGQVPAWQARLMTAGGAYPSLATTLASGEKAR